MSRPQVGLALVLLLAGGCLPMPVLDPAAQEPGTTVVPTSPFGGPSTAAARTVPTSYGPASADMAMRVDKIGREICVANPQAGLKPLFATYGSPKPEIFHQGTKLVNVTDSLVRNCKTDAELAAVLCLELAKMVAEREATAPSKARHPEERPPMAIPIGNAGQFGAMDQARLVELARYEERRRAASQPLAPLDPQVLAGNFLENTGYSRAELRTIQPLLRTAEGNYVLEKQFKDHGVSGWVPGP